MILLLLYATRVAGDAAVALHELGEQAEALALVGAVQAVRGSCLACPKPER